MHSECFGDVSTLSTGHVFNLRTIYTSNCEVLSSEMRSLSFGPMNVIQSS